MKRCPLPPTSIQSDSKVGFNNTHDALPTNLTAETVTIPIKDEGSFRSKMKNAAVSLVCEELIPERLANIIIGEFSHD